MDPGLLIFMVKAHLYLWCKQHNLQFYSSAILASPIIICVTERLVKKQSLVSVITTVSIHSPSVLNMLRTSLLLLLGETAYAYKLLVVTTLV
jgi:hypothetical protein